MSTDALKHFEYNSEPPEPFAITEGGKKVYGHAYVEAEGVEKVADNLASETDRLGNRTAEYGTTLSRAEREKLENALKTINAARASIEQLLAVNAKEEPQNEDEKGKEMAA